jgi:hypothetical protein
LRQSDFIPRQFLGQPPQRNSRQRAIALIEGINAMLYTICEVVYNSIHTPRPGLEVGRQR